MSDKQYVVIGLGHFGHSVAENLYSMGYDVLAIDSSEEKVQSISNCVTHAVQADATDETVLKSLGISNFEVAVIGMGSDIQSSIMVTLLVKELGVKYVVVKALSELHAKVLYKIGADRVIFPERDMGIRVAHNLISTNILDYIELSPDYSIAEVSAEKEWENRSLRDLSLRSKYGINVMAIKRGGKINLSPTADDEILEGDILVIIGANDYLSDLHKVK
jgi:K+ transport systems, NAD-binding component